MYRCVQGKHSMPCRYPCYSGCTGTRIMRCLNTGEVKMPSQVLSVDSPLISTHTHALSDLQKPACILVAYMHVRSLWVRSATQRPPHL